MNTIVASAGCVSDLPDLLRADWTAAAVRHYSDIYRTTAERALMQALQCHALWVARSEQHCIGMTLCSRLSADHLHIGHAAVSGQYDYPDIADKLYSAVYDDTPDETLLTVTICDDDDQTITARLQAAGFHTLDAQNMSQRLRAIHRREIAESEAPDRARVLAA